MYQNYPNPFNSSTVINYEISKPGLVNIDLFDINGRKLINIINQYDYSGRHKILLKTSEFKLASGIYYLRMSYYDTINSSTIQLLETKKIILLK